MFVSLTRLRVRSRWSLPAFLRMTFYTKRQVERAEGFRGGRLLVDEHRTYWTLTMWESEQAMKAYRGSEAHAKAMPRLARWCDEGAYTHWAQEDETVPSWPEAYQRLLSDGKLSRVDRPSADHDARKFPPPCLKPLIGTDLQPVS